MGGTLAPKPVAPVSPPRRVFPRDRLRSTDSIYGPYDSSDVFSRTVDRGPAAYAAQFSPPSSAPPTGGAAPVSWAPLQSDHAFQLAKAIENQGIGSLDTWLKSARERAIIQSGDPALASMSGFGLDPQAGVFAQQNYLSGNADLARVKRAGDLARRSIVNKLSARGLLRSGDLGYLEGQANIDFGNQEYDVRQQVLSKLSDFMQQYLDRKQALKQLTVSALQGVYDRYASNPDLLASLTGNSGDSNAASPYQTVPTSTMSDAAARAFADAVRF